MKSGTQELHFGFCDNPFDPIPESREQKHYMTCQHITAEQIGYLWGEKMDPYKHLVQYYETDMMGVTHHANYVHWMEEARIAFMDRVGFPYAKMEAEGVISPVVEVSCRYKRPCTFGDVISISVEVESFSGVKMALVYDMRNSRDETVCTARSEHTFTDRSGRIVRLKKVMPEFCAAIENAVELSAAIGKER